MNTEGYLLDTSVASSSWDMGSPSHGAVLRRLNNLGDGLVFVSVVSFGEVEYGLAAAPKIVLSRQETVRTAMGSYRVRDVNRHTAKVYGEIRGDLFRKYSPRDRRGRLTAKWVEDLIERTTGKELGIQENDLWILSTAKQHNLVLVTMDRMRRLVEVADYSRRTEYWGGASCC